MGQYKGKREASRTENEVKQSKRMVDDPFKGEKPSFGERIENVFLDINWFFHSKKFKVLMSVLCSLLVIGVGGVYAFKAWMNRPPELPVVDNSGSQNPSQNNQGQTQQPDDSGEQLPPSDDELYPDDGYDGEMPEVSGERKKGVYTFLLVGTDKDDGNTDTIMVVSYDTVKQKISVMSIPRDTMINESWDIKRLNSVYSRTGNSINSLANRIKKLVGFKLDYYVKVELSVFVQLVDLVGGVEFYVPCNMKYDDPTQDLHIDLQEGLQLLDGDKAMQLVRFRGYSEGDIKRAEVQQEFLKALIKECLSLKHWGKVKAYIDLALENVQTDMNFGSIVWFAANVMGLNDAPMLDMSNVMTCTIPGDYWGKAWSRATNSMQSYVVIYPGKVVELVNEHFNPYVQDITTEMLDAMKILENGDIASSTGVLKDTKHNEVMAVRRGEAYYDANGKLVYYSTEDDNKSTDDDPVTSGDDQTGGDDNTATGGEDNTSTGGDNGTSGKDTQNNADTGSEGDDSGESEDNGEGDEPVVPDEPVISDEPTVPNDGEE